MFLKGDLLVRLEPLIDEVPVIGGIVSRQVRSCLFQVEIWMCPRVATCQHVATQQRNIWKTFNAAASC